VTGFGFRAAREPTAVSSIQNGLPVVSIANGLDWGDDSSQLFSAPSMSRVDSVTESSQIVVLQSGAGGVPADDSRDKLNNQIDDRFHDARLSLAELPWPRGRYHPRSRYAGSRELLDDPLRAAIPAPSMARRR
jgi:hypothetical protein